MNSKSLLIAIAALALTASGAQAFSGDALVQAGLTESQRAAFEVARELREDGDMTGARDVLVEAGIDEKVIDKVRNAMHKDRHGDRAAMHAALEADDYDAFILAIADSPLADVITTKADFASFKEAHELMKSGDKDGAKAIFTELGIPEPKDHSEQGKGHGHGKGGPGKLLEQLSDSQEAAFQVARAANDRDAMDAILEEAGITRGDHTKSPKTLRDGRELE